MIQKVSQLEVLLIVCSRGEGPQAIAAIRTDHSVRLCSAFSNVVMRAAGSGVAIYQACMYDAAPHAASDLHDPVQRQASLTVQETQRNSSSDSLMASGPDGHALQHDWVHQLELDGALELSRRLGGPPLRVLVLYGSLRERSYSKLLALEFSRSVSSKRNWPHKQCEHRHAQQFLSSSGCV